LRRILHYPALATRLAPRVRALFEQVRQDDSPALLVPALELLNQLPERSTNILVKTALALTGSAEGENDFSNGIAWMLTRPGSTGLAMANAAIRLFSEHPGARECLGGDSSFAQGLETALARLEGGGGVEEEGGDIHSLRFRLLEFSVAVARNCGGKISSSRSLAPVAAAYFSDDILIKLNAVELFVELGSSEIGRNFLSEQHMIEKIAEELKDENFSSIDSRVTPTCALFLSYALRIRNDLILFNKLWPILQPRLVEFSSQGSQAHAKKLILLQIFSQLSYISFENDKDVIGPGSLLYEFAKESLKSSDEELCRAACATWVSIGGGSSKLRDFGPITEAAVDIWARRGASLRPFSYQLLSVTVSKGNNIKELFSCTNSTNSKGLELRREILENMDSEPSHDARMERYGFLKAILNFDVVQKNKVTVEEVLGSASIARITAIVKSGPYGNGGNGGKKRLKTNNEDQRNGGGGIGEKVESMTL